MLTTGTDVVAGTAGADTITAGEVGGVAAFTVGDSIDGGAGADTLNWVQTAPVNAVPVGASVTNVETMNVTSGGAIALNTATGFTGLTNLNANTSAANQTLTAAATTDVVANAAAQGATAVSVNGGNDVNVNATGVTTGLTTVGATTAAAGEVNVTSTGADLVDGAGATTGTLGAIAVTGGTKVDVTSTGTVSGGSNDAGDALTLSAVNVTGNASTTEVSVTQTAAQAQIMTSAGVTGQAAIVNGAVTITDANAASATAAGTIATVNLNSYGNSTIDSSALTTVNLSGTGGTLGISRGALTATPTANELTLNVSGLTAGAITDAEAAADDGFKTINVASTDTKSTIADLTVADATAINVSGDAAVAFTANTGIAAVTDIVVTNTAGASFGTILGNAVNFTGGAGADAVTLGQTTKAIDMGAGDDTVTLTNATLGAGGTVNGGDGNDILVANTNGSSFSADPAVGGFETLRVAGTAAAGTHNANGFTALQVGVLAGAATFTNVAAGTGLTINAAPTAGTTVTLANATGTADVFNLTLASDATIDADTVTLAGVETVNIVSDDTEVATTPTANVNLLDLDATAATSIVVTGDAGLNIDSTGNTAVTNFDASAVTGEGSNVTFVSANTTVGEVVNIKGGAGADNLTGSATANDVIDGGAGADTLVYTGGADTFTGGAGNDIFDIDAAGTKTALATIADLTSGDAIDIASFTTVNVADGALGAKVTLGAAATLDQYLDAASVGAAGTAEWFQFNGDTYLVADQSAGATFVEGTDAIVKIAGIADLSTSSFASEVLTFA